MAALKIDETADGAAEVITKRPLDFGGKFLFRAGGGVLAERGQEEEEEEEEVEVVG
jgi:hypothetical protein